MLKPECWLEIYLFLTHQNMIICFWRIRIWYSFEKNIRNHMLGLISWSMKPLWGLLATSPCRDLWPGRLENIQSLLLIPPLSPSPLTSSPSWCSIIRFTITTPITIIRISNHNLKSSCRRYQNIKFLYWLFVRQQKCLLKTFLHEWHVRKRIFKLVQTSLAPIHDF